MTTEKHGWYISDMNCIKPHAVLSPRLAKGKWQLIPYETADFKGTMIGAPSFLRVPEVTVPLRASGWHAVYLGYWNPYMTYDPPFALKIKLSGDTAFVQIAEPEPPPNLRATFIREVLFRQADLTGRDLVVAKPNGPLGKQCFLAYVKLVPLRRDQVAVIRKDQKRKDTRNLIAAIDGSSYFYGGEYTRPEHILELVEPYRYSDVSRVMWAANYGDIVNYPSKVPGSVYMGANRGIARLIEGEGSNPRSLGEKQAHDSLKALARRGMVPQQLAARHAHGMGIKFDLMFRLGILGRILHDAPFPSEFLNRYPHTRQVLRDGTIIDKASFAFPEVRRFMLDLIEEATGTMDVDGVNLCFIRGPAFLMYEQPILDAFKAKYGLDARKVNPKDRRLWSVRAGFMTEFVREAKKIAENLARKKGRKIELSVWVWPWRRTTWCGQTPREEGLDVKTWINEGLLDRLVCHEWFCRDYQAWCKARGIPLHLFPRWWGKTAVTPKTINRAYRIGVSGFAVWDLDARQTNPDEWAWLRRVGHRDEMARWNPKQQKPRLIPITKLNHFDTTKALEWSVYSGG